MAKSHIIGYKLKQIRKMRGLTQAEFAELFSVSRKTLGKYEKGKPTPSGEFIDKVCKHFGIAVSYFFEEETDEDVKKEARRKQKYLHIKEKRTLIVFDGEQRCEVELPDNDRKVFRKQSIPNNVFIILFGITVGILMLANLIPSPPLVHFLYGVFISIFCFGIHGFLTRIELSSVSK